MALPARLLLLDDERAVRGLLSRKLLSSGYHVDLAEGGYQAIEMVHSRPYDLPLLDCMMPGIGGLEVLRRIRERWSPSELPVIMVTVIQESADVGAAVWVGANDFLT